MKKLLFLVALAAFTPPLLAGNIPQYRLVEGGGVYSDCDGFALTAMEFRGNAVLFADGTMTPNPYKGPGFPIGFSLRLGGRTFDSFAVSNHGELWLGSGLEVDYGGDAFRVGMSPTQYGLYRAEVSYGTVGEAGSRVLTVQYRNAILNETGSGKGRYSLQIRLHEQDGRVEFAMKELETTYSGCGFETGLSGWDGDDVLLLTAPGLASVAAVSGRLKADMLDSSSYIRWDADDYDMGYAPVYTLLPVSDTTPPAAAPSALTVTQDGDDLRVSCRRAEGAAATAVLFSTEPFADGDLPVDGETFRASYTDANGIQRFPTRLGKAYALCYGNGEEVSATIRNVGQGDTYYIRAFSANGYPAWNRTDFAEVVYGTAQAAPDRLTARADGPDGILLSCEAADPVIIAATTERVPGYDKGYHGQFGTPSATAAAGDAIAGGGTVVYSGPAGEFRVAAEPNAMTYFRAWTVRDGRLSSTATDCACAPAASLPYEPKVEEYPQWTALLGWTSLPAGDFPSHVTMPRNSGDGNAVRTISANGRRMTLTTPPIPADRPLRVSFEWAMETVRDAEASEDSGSVALPKGNKPGEFGDGSLDLLLDGTLLRSTDSYGGTMTLFGSDAYEEGSSTYETFTADVPSGTASGAEGRLTVSFAGDSGNTSVLYLRNLRVEAIGEAETAPACAPTALTVDEDRDGFLHVGCTRGDDAARTVVLVSEKPITASDLPADGITLTAGTRTGNAVVIYSGEDTEVTCATDGSTLVSDYDTPYHVAAVSVSPSSLYNRTDITQVEYRTLPDFGAPTALAAGYDAEARALDITATRHANAGATLILVSAGATDTTPVDGGEYPSGTTLGNATVAYHGTDAEITFRHELEEVPASVTVTAWSRNVKGWYSTQPRTVTVPTVNVGVDSIATEPDLTEAEVYDITGLRLRATRLTDLPAGLYIINGRKVTVR